jgi:putative sigma-54 modulation protein
MRLVVKGKNLEVNERLKAYAEEKLGKLERHLRDDASQVEVELSVEHNRSIAQRQIAEATIWTKGPVLRAHESADDMRTAIDLVADKLERQVKRYREKRQRRQLARHGNHHQPLDPSAPPPDIEAEPTEPMIVKTKQFAIKPMPPEEAVLQLELVGHDFFVFRNVESDEVNVVYRRRDGNYGLIEPSP